MLRLIALAALSMLMFVAAAGSAEAKVFRGKTDKGRRAAVIIGSDGLLRTASVHWRAHCIQGGRLADKTYFLRPHDESTRDRFADSGTFRRTDDHGYRLRFTTSIRGHLTVGERGERWRGTFRLKILVTRKGRYVDTCRTGRLRFTLRPV